MVPLVTPETLEGSTLTRSPQPTTGLPLVSVLITAHNRPDELRATLRALKSQDYAPLELLIIDDASAVELGAVVRDEWPAARFWRNPRNLGLIASRTLGMGRASGRYVLTLDDDSHPVDAAAISRAVARFEREPQLGVIAFRVHEGVEPPRAEPGAPEPYYTHSFLGCGEMMRTAVARELGAYRDFFVYYAEESEFSLRAIGRGWRILHDPGLVVLHRASPIGRSNAKIVAYSFRNMAWTTLLDLPFPRALVDLAWKLATGGVEVVRQGDARWMVWALWSFLRGLPRVARERTPISREALRVYDALRFRRVLTPEALESPAAITWRERWTWFNGAFRNRRRAPAAWDRRGRPIGDGAWTTPGSAGP
ncbi:hypothetical protein tb265_36200 [Gemmatimonadetes bacterium T265]|nr:hypothetical protein tb265_36200 [Gemmatimonadetes bacterium T265]